MRGNSASKADFNELLILENGMNRPTYKSSHKKPPLHEKLHFFMFFRIKIIFFDAFGIDITAH